MVPTAGLSKEKPMRRLWLLVLLGCLIAAPSLGADVINRVAAVVDNQVITLFEIETVANAMIASAQQADPNATPAEREAAAIAIKQQVLQQMIEQKLIESEVKRLGIEVTEGEIDSYVERVKKSNNYSDEAFANALRAEGLTMLDFRERVKMEILRERYVNFRMRDKLQVRDEDIRAYYENNRDQFSAEPIVRIAEIRFNVPPEADQATLEAAFTAANSTHERLLGGEPFDAVARQVSQGPTAADGGLLGEFKLDSELKPTYRKAVLTTEPGKSSTIYRDANGFFILLVLEKKITGTIPFEQVEDKIRMILRKKQADTEMQRLGAELRKKSFVDIRVSFDQPKP